jgi:hypothetical protein
MANTSVDVGASLKPEQKIWRYLSFDKLVSLLESECLYLAPIANLVAFDPFEGYLPKVALEAMAGMFSNRLHSLESVVSQIRNNARHQGKYSDPAFQKGDLEITKYLEEYRTGLFETYHAVAMSTAVNCWHMNDHESEAMWKLYSDGGKGVAIESDVISLRKSVEERESVYHAWIGAIRYFDFYDSNLKSTDCLSDGHLVPLAKRKAFEHEKELRLFVTSDVEAEHSLPTPKPVLLPVDLTRLIKRIVVSPFAQEPYSSSVRAVCTKYGIKNVCESQLLNGHEQFANILRLK